MKGQKMLLKAACAAMMLAVGAGHLAAESILVKFDGGIGVTPVLSFVAPANADGTFANVTQNIVRTILPSGNPWKIDELKATVHTDGRIAVAGRGLVLAGGSRIGQSLFLPVFATLICEPAAPFDFHSTTTDLSLDPPKLDDKGDFRIDDVLDTPLPAECLSPVLLIRAIGGNNTWLAAAKVKLD